MKTKRRLIVGISGASGIIYGVRLLELLRKVEVETHLVVSRAAERTRACELNLSTQELRALATVSYRVGDIGAAIASGSFRTMGMVIAPCSARTLAEIASGASTSLLTRAADVVLKERRPAGAAGAGDTAARHPFEKHADGHRGWRYCDAAGAGIL